MNKKIPPETIDTFARSIFKEALNYGFGQVDIVRLINNLVDQCAGADGSIQMPPKANNHNFVDAAGQSLNLPVTGDNVIIRTFDRQNDVELLERWLHDKHGRYFVLSWSTAQSVTIDSLVGNPSNHIGIITLRDERPIGAMAFLDYSKEQERAEIRKLIGDVSSRGKGFAQEATRLWIEYGVGTLGLRKVYLSTLQTQMKNIKLNESMGFRVEGLLRNEIQIDGIRHDVLRMGLCVS